MPSSVKTLFLEFLGGGNYTEDDAKEIINKELLRDFGPDEESFKSFYKEIDSLKAWRKKPNPEQLIQKNVAVKEVTLKSISILWDPVEGAKSYLVEVDGDEVFWRPGTSNTFTKRGFLPDTEHTFRVLTIHEKVMSEWSNVARGRTQIFSAPSNVKIMSVGSDSITLTWDAVEGASYYQIEVDESRSLDVSSINSFAKRGLLPDTGHSFRVRVVKEGKVSEWSDAVKGKT